MTKPKRTSVKAASAIGFPAVAREAVPIVGIGTSAGGLDALERFFKQTPGAQGALQEIFILLRERTGADFSEYKQRSLSRRIDRRMKLQQIEGMLDYVRFLRENEQELDLLFRELLIGVTNFFRDPAVWGRLKAEVLPTLMAAHSDRERLRAWVPACSTGEEAYSLAMTFVEVMDSLPAGSRYSLQIFATDLDPDAILRARKCFYPPNIAAEVSPQRLARFFVEEEKGFRVSKAIREMVIFAPQNVLMDPPFSKLDFVCCRNLLIYLGADAQERMLSMFHCALNPDGLLVLGQSESADLGRELFSALSGQHKIYQRKDTARPTAFIGIPGTRFRIPRHPDPEHDIWLRRDAPQNPAEGLTHRQLVTRILLRRYAPAAVLVNAEGDILYVSGNTGQYLEPAAGQADWNIYAMACDGLRYPLADAMKIVTMKTGAVTLKGLQLSRNGKTHWVDLTLESVVYPGRLNKCVLIVFLEAAAPPPEAGWEVGRSPTSRTMLATELRLARDELEALHDELQSTREELQSNIEELVTSREELESLNEELQTVNAELRVEVEDMTAVQDDMKNMLDSTGLACIFLDSQLRVRSFTPFATHIFKLRTSDTGRPLLDIMSDLDYSRFPEEMQHVLDTLQCRERKAATRDRRWFNIRIMPYRTANDVIDGLVITLTDITGTRQPPFE
jgi:chemotaxis protein methyltransferase CheR/two-component system CheB/CheR fusion protein